MFFMFNHKLSFTQKDSKSELLQSCPRNQLTQWLYTLLGEAQTKHEEAQLTEEIFGL